MTRTVGVFEEKVKLIKRRSRHLPVVLLVQIAEKEGVGEELVEIRNALTPHPLGEGNGHVRHRGRGLNRVPGRDGMRCGRTTYRCGG